MRLLLSLLLYIASASFINALPHASDQDELDPILQQKPLHTTVLMAGGAAASAPTVAPLPSGSRDHFKDLWAGEYEKAFEGYGSVCGKCWSDRG